MIRISQWRVNISVRKNKSKEQNCGSQSGIQIGKLTMSVRSLDLSVFTKPIRSTRTVLPVLLMNVKSLKTNSLADWLIKRASSMLDEIAPKTVHQGGP